MLQIQALLFICLFYHGTVQKVIEMILAFDFRFNILQSNAKNIEMTNLAKAKWVQMRKYWAISLNSCDRSSGSVFS